MDMRDPPPPPASCNRGVDYWWLSVISKENKRTFNGLFVPFCIRQLKVISCISVWESLLSQCGWKCGCCTLSLSHANFAVHLIKVLKIFDVYENELRSSVRKTVLTTPEHHCCQMKLPASHQELKLRDIWLFTWLFIYLTCAFFLKKFSYQLWPLDSTKPLKLQTMNTDWELLSKWSIGNKISIKKTKQVIPLFFCSNWALSYSSQ